MQVYMNIIKRKNVFLFLSIFSGFLYSSLSSANGQFENRAWQFDSPTKKSVRAIILDLEQRQRGGFFDGFNTVTNNTFETNIFGDQINCDVSATSIGNSDTNLVDSRTGSPVGATDAFDSGSQGNTSDTLARLGGIRGNSGGEVINNQTSTNSPVSSSINDSGIFLDIGEQNSSGTSNIDLASNQNNSGSTLDASILNSNACVNPGSGN